MVVPTGYLLLVAGLIICLIAKVSPTGTSKEDFDVRRYALHLGIYLRQLPKDSPLKDVVTKVQNFMSRPEQYHKITPNVMECQDLLLSLEEVERGEFCGVNPETRNVLELCYNSLFYTEDDTIAPFIIRAFEGHRSHCRSKNIESLRKAISEVPADVMQHLSPIFTDQGSESSCLRSVYQGKKIFDYDSASCHMYDAIVRTLSQCTEDPKAIKLLQESKRATISEGKLVKLYDRLVYQPCVTYNGIVGPAFAAFKHDEEFLRAAERSDELTDLLVGSVICTSLTGRKADLHFSCVKEEIAELQGKSVTTGLGEAIKRSIRLQKLPTWCLI